jgi:hypothetical protein
MINIDSFKQNTLSPTLTIAPISTSNHFLFVFIDSYNRDVSCMLTNISTTPKRYVEFIYTDGSDATLLEAGDMYIYDASLNLCLIDTYQLFPHLPDDIIYDTSLFYSNAADPNWYTTGNEDYVYDPSTYFDITSQTMINIDQNFIFDPLNNKY